MEKKSLPPGFRFHPTDVELVKFYLKRKVMGRNLHGDFIAEVDIYKFAPWDLPDKSSLLTGDLKWYFFCSREKKYANGARMNRATEFGYWKTTGKDRPVQQNDEVVGLVKTLVFHRGKAPRGERTDWVIHEYKIQDSDLASRCIPQDTYVVCVLFQKNGPGPRNGAQYGAPFKEEDWTDEDEDEVVNCDGTVSYAGPLDVAASKEDPEVQVGDDVDQLLACFTDEPIEKVPQGETVSASSSSHENDIFADLGDLGKLGKLDDFSCTYTQMLLDDASFLELDDLEKRLE